MTAAPPQRSPVPSCGPELPELRRSVGPGIRVKACPSVTLVLATSVQHNREMTSESEEGRYFCSFDPRGRLASQRDLIEELERRSLEQGNRRILTAHYGVPITVFLLLLRDAIQRLRDLDNHLRARKQSHGNVSHTKAVEFYGLQAIAGCEATAIEGVDWSHETVVGIDAAGPLSGVVVASEIDILSRPSDVPLKDLYKSSNPDTVVMSNVVKIGGGKSQDVPLVEHIKEVMLALEMFYAIQERIAVECDRFAEHFGIEKPQPRFPSDFAAQAQRRGSLIHEGELRLGVDSRECALTLKNKPVTDEFSGAFDGGIDAIELLYSRMHEAVTKGQ